MRLRRRLIAVQAGLVALGLIAFGLLSYHLYSDSAYQRVDTELQSASPLLSRSLGPAPGAAPGTPGAGRPPGSADQPPVGGPPSGAAHNLPAGSYAELRRPGGAVVDHYQVPCYSSKCPVPKLPLSLPAINSPAGRVFTVPATDGSTTFRVLARNVNDEPYLASIFGTSATVVTAVPLTEVTRSLHNLLLLDLLVGVGVLVVLSALGLLIIRRGLSPLERMTATARAIAHGDLSRRARPADGRGEVGQLGLAFNTMMGTIAQAFAARDSTEARLRQFLADASHELRTPLTSIRGYAELYRMGAIRENELPAIMARIELDANHMGGLVEELLLLAQLDQTRPPERTPIDLVTLVADVCDTVKVGAQTRSLRLDADGPVSVVGDPGHLRQAVTNLLTNAVRHTPEHAPIEVAVLRDGGVAEVRVADHGPGLSEEGLAHAFDRFWRADTARNGTGSGLGLAIVAAVAAEHGGQVTVTNASGGGAIFDLRLPVPSQETLPLA